MKRILGVVLAVSAIVTAGNAVAQANYPEKPIRIIVGFPAGSSPDITARHLGQKLAESWAKSVVVDNVPGAAGNIAMERVAKAAPDGYTLALAVNAQVIINPSLYKLPYDPVRDFAPVSQVSVLPNILVVHSVVPAKTLRELVTLARARPGEIHVRLRWQRQLAPPGRRVAEVRGWSRHPTHSLQGRRRGGTGPACRARHDDVQPHIGGLTPGAR